MLSACWQPNSDACVAAALAAVVAAGDAPAAAVADPASLSKMSAGAAGAGSGWRMPLAAPPPAPLLECQSRWCSWMDGHLRRTCLSGLTSSQRAAQGVACLQGKCGKRVVRGWVSEEKAGELLS
eukprot:1161796-Pelagomonas_calceolata.AAC.13